MTENYEQYKFVYPTSNVKESTTTAKNQVTHEMDYLSKIQKNFSIFGLGCLGPVERTRRDQRNELKSKTIVLDAIVGSWKIVSIKKKLNHCDGSFHRILFTSADQHFEYTDGKLRMWESLNGKNYNKAISKLGQEFCYLGSEAISFVENGKLVTAFFSSGTVDERSERFVLNGKLHIVTKKFSNVCERIYEKIGMESGENNAKKRVDSSDASKAKIQPVLSEMPWNVKQAIADSADMKDKFRLRQCSLEWLELTKKSKMNMHKFEIQLHGRYISVNMKIAKSNRVDHTTSHTAFWRCREGYVLRSRDGFWHESHVIGDYIHAAAENFIEFAKMEKVHLESFSIRMYPSASQDTLRQFMKYLGDCLSSMGHKLKAERLEIMCVGEDFVIPAILPHLETNYLRDIKVKCYPRVSDQDHLLHLQSILEFPQFKSAKSLDIEFLTDVTYEDLKNLSTLKSRTDHLSVQMVSEIVENGLTNPNFKSVTIQFRTTERKEIDAFSKKRKQTYHAAVAAAREASGQYQKAEDVKFKFKLTQTEFSFAKK